MGLALLANVAAHDFGYIGVGQLIERTANTPQSMETLERHAGHFYNWYDTETKAPLTRYISTVDSGNLAGHLLTLRAGLLEVAGAPIVGEKVFLALTDTLQILEKIPGCSSVNSLAQFEKALMIAMATQPSTIAGVRVDLDRLVACSRAVLQEIVEGPPAVSRSEAHEWAQILNRQCEDALAELTSLAFPPLLSATEASGHESTRAARIPSLGQLALQGNERARDLLARLERLALQAGEMAQMEYGFLFNYAQRQLAIGYNVGERRLDASYYDLLASEARLCNFVAIAQGELPQESWFALGRMLTTSGGEAALLSWSGSMFEYLMPLLVMPTFDNTLLDQTCKAAVERQIAW